MKKTILITLASVFVFNSAYSAEAQEVNISGVSQCQAKTKIDEYDCLNNEITQIKNQIEGLEKSQTLSFINIFLSVPATVFLLQHKGKGGVGSFGLEYVETAFARLLGLGIGANAVHSSYKLTVRTQEALGNFRLLLATKQEQLTQIRQTLDAQQAAEKAIE